LEEEFFSRVGGGEIADPSSDMSLEDEFFSRIGGS